MIHFWLLKYLSVSICPFFFLALRAIKPAAAMRPNSLPVQVQLHPVTASHPPHAAAGEAGAAWQLLATGDRDEAGFPGGVAVSFSALNTVRIWPKWRLSIAAQVHTFLKNKLFNSTAVASEGVVPHARSGRTVSVAQRADVTQVDVTQPRDLSFQCFFNVGRKAGNIFPPHKTTLARHRKSGSGGSATRLHKVLF